MNATKVRALRDRLGLDRGTFARLCGVDVRSVYRWESGEVEPQGVSLALLLAIHDQIKVPSAHAERVVRFLADTARMGGFALVVSRLLDRLDAKR